MGAYLSSKRCRRSTTLNILSVPTWSNRFSESPNTNFCSRSYKAAATRRAKENLRWYLFLFKNFFFQKVFGSEEEGEMVEVCEFRFCAQCSPLDLECRTDLKWCWTFRRKSTTHYTSRYWTDVICHSTSWEMSSCTTHFRYNCFPLFLSFFFFVCFFFLIF